MKIENEEPKSSGDSQPCFFETKLKNRKLQKAVFMTAFSLGEKMKFYFIDNKYIEYLQKFDEQVKNYKGEKYTKNRTYIGIILEVNDCKYLAPLSSPKKTDYNIDGSIRKTIVPLIRMIGEREDDFLGTIKLSAMIPIFDNKVISKYDLDNETDIMYKKLLLKQRKFININKELIIKNATKLYKQKIKKMKIGYLKSTIDFKLIEEKAKEYK